MPDDRPWGWLGPLLVTAFGGFLRFNQLQAPFNNLKMRQAMLLVVNQADFITALAGDPKHWNECASFFTCGGPMANEDGSQILIGPRDFAASEATGR